MWASHFTAIALLAFGEWPRLAFAIPAARMERAVSPIVSTIYVPRSACPATSTTVSTIAATTTSFTDGTAQTPTVLQPTAGVNIDTSAHGNLVPDSFANLTYYETDVDDGDEATVAVLSMNQTDYPAVNMLHTTFISSLTCSNSTAKITFNSTLAYETASTSWPSAIPFVMITYHEECGEAFANGEHGFVSVQRIITADPGNLIMELGISHAEFGTVVGAANNVTVDIGKHTPGRLGSFGVVSSTFATKPKSGLNSTFDEKLDDSLGPYISLEEATHWPQLLPDLDTSTLPSDGVPVTNGDGFPSLDDRRRVKRSLERRWGFWDKIVGPFSTVGKALEQGVKFVVTTATSVGKFITKEASK